MKDFLMIFVVASFLLFACNISFAADPMETPKPVETTSQALSLIEIYNLTNALPKELIDLRSNIAGQADVTGILEQITDLKRAVEEMEWETTMATTDANISRYELSALDAKQIKINVRIARLNKPISANILALEALSKEWQAKEDKLKQFILQTETQPSLTDSLPPSDSLTQIVQTANKLIGEQIGPNLLAGREIGQIQARTYTFTEMINDRARDVNTLGFQQTSPSVLSTAFYSRFNHELLEQSKERVRLFSIYQKGYLKNNLAGVLTFLASIAFVAFLTRMSRPLVNRTHLWYQFTDDFLATGVFIVSTICVFVEAIAVNVSLPPSCPSCCRFQ